MNDVKHTPGPWEASGQLILTSQLYPHANPRAQHEPKIIGEVHWDYDGDHGAKESRIGWTEAAANQQLMIAAPEMLEALKGWDIIFNNREGAFLSPLVKSCLKETLAAIAKATGQQQPVPSA